MDSTSVPRETNMPAKDIEWLDKKALFHVKQEDGLFQPYRMFHVKPVTVYVAFKIPHSIMYPRPREMSICKW